MVQDVWLIIIELSKQQYWKPAEQWDSHRSPAAFEECLTRPA